MGSVPSNTASVSIVAPVDETYASYMDNKKSLKPPERKSQDYIGYSSVSSDRRKRSLAELSVDSNTSSEITAFTEKIMKDWESWTSNILSKVFFNEENASDVNLLLFIDQEIIFERKQDVEAFVKLVVEDGIVDVCVRILSLSPFQSLVGSPPKLLTLSSLLCVIWNCCDATSHMGRAVISKQLHTAIIGNIGKPFFKVDEMTKLEKSEEIISILHPMFSVLYNTLRHNPDCKQVFREDGVIDISLTYLQADDPMIKTLALFVLTFAADISANRKLIEATSCNIQFIIRSLLHPAMDTPDHLSDGWSVQEILQALALLSENSENAKEMANSGLLELCREILELGFSDLEVKCTLDIVWSMTFLEELRDKIAKCERLLASVAGNKSSANQDIVRSAAGIQWNLKNLHETVSVGDHIIPSGDHIMISYCWEQKSLAWLLKEKLTKAGKTVWIDTKNMQGDVFDAMADAVEKSSFVICCISEDYAGSRFCQQEAKYACQQDKQVIFVKVQENYSANGWLGLLMAGAFYYEMHSEQDVQRNFSRLLAFMEGQPFLEESKQVKNEETESGSPPPRKGHHRHHQHIATNVATWSREDVMKWFQNTGCSQSAKARNIILELDGKSLREFCSWRNNAPEFFLKTVKDEFGFSLADLIKFSSAIRSLTEKKGK